jgi:hypothetical protein
MSSWWSITFFVTGEFSKIREFEEALPSLFHVLGEKDRIGGGLIADVGQNYGGGAAMEDAIARYPDLIFNGSMAHEPQPGDTYWVFTAKNGEAEWHEFSLPDEDRPMTPEEIEGEIARIDDKIAGLNTCRETYLFELRKTKAAVENSSDPVCGLRSGGSIDGRDAPEVAAMIARLKGNQHTR